MADCNDSADITLTPPRPECDSATLPSYAITVEELTALRAHCERLERAARTALEVIEPGTYCGSDQAIRLLREALEGK